MDKLKMNLRLAYWREIGTMLLSLAVAYICLNNSLTGAMHSWVKLFTLIFLLISFSCLRSFFVIANIYDATNKVFKSMRHDYRLVETELHDRMKDFLLSEKGGKS